MIKNKRPLTPTGTKIYYTGTTGNNFTASETMGIADLPVKVEQPTLHKQSRSALKTFSLLTGRDKTQVSLFEKPRFEEGINPYKESIARNTAIVGNYLIKLWQQKNKDGVCTIDNLTKVAKKLNMIPQDLKTYLVYLGGYQYPVITTKDKITKGGKMQRILSTYTTNIFIIKFNSKLKKNETEDSFNKDLRVGTRYLSFIKNRDIDTVEVEPNPALRDDLQGKRLGNILTSDDFFVFALGLTDMAYKLFTFSGSNEPVKKIRLDKLIDSLGLEEQTKKQGKPRILRTIKKALNELKTKGHFIKWEYQEDKEMFDWEYSNKIFKHKLLLTKNNS